MQHYYHCQTKPTPCIPNMEGKWTFTITRLARDTIEEEANFDKIYTTVGTYEFEQKNNFIIIKGESGTKLAVLAFMNDVWTLQWADSTDNGTAFFVPKVKGDYTCWTGNYIESGFSDNPEQRQVVGLFEIKKQTECYCCPHC